MDIWDDEEKDLDVDLLYDRKGTPHIVSEEYYRKVWDGLLRPGEDTDAKVAARKILMAGFKMLTEKQRTVIELILKNYSLYDIAETLGISYSGVVARRNAAIKKLRNRIPSLLRSNKEV